MTETVQAGDAAEVICTLKAAVNALECQYKKNLMEQQAMRKTEKSKTSGKQPPMFIMIPLEQKGTGGDDVSITGEKSLRKQKNRQDDFEDYDVASLDCDKKRMKRGLGGRGGYGGPDGYGGNGGKYDDREEGSGLRGGAQQARCSCIHRDGLQDDCPLPQCQDEPACHTRPWATCPPARLFVAMHPEIFPPSHQTY